MSDLVGHSLKLSTAPCLGVPLFTPWMAPDSGLLIVGTALGLEVLEQHRGQSVSVYGAIPAVAWISGFAYHAGSLYVQDGSVLTRWDFTGTAPVQGGSIDLAAAVPDAASLQQGLRLARLREAWAVLLNAAEGLSSVAAQQQPYDGFSFDGPDLKAPVAAVSDPPGLSSMLCDIRTLLGSGTPTSSDPSLSVETIRAARVAAEAAAASVVFSAPVVQQNQSESSPTQTVFVLGADGTVHALDDPLDASAATATGGAAMPVLCAAEPADASRGLTLFYPTATGISMMDFSDPAAAPGATQPWAVPVASPSTPQLPLAAVDGLLWCGGGGLGPALFAVPLPSPAGGGAAPGEDAPWQPVLNVAGAWTDYVVDTGGQLAAVTDGTGTRLLCYAPQAGERDRWGSHAAPSPSWTVFVPASGAPPPAPPLLVVEVDQQAPDGTAGVGVSYRLYPANTADDPRGLTTFAPPDALLTGTLSTPRAPPRSVLARPAVTGDSAGEASLYLLATPYTPTEQLPVLFTPVNGSSPWSAFAPTASATAPPPPLTNASVYVWELNDLGAMVDPATQATVAAAANAYLGEMQALAGKVTLFVTRTELTGFSAGERVAAAGRAVTVSDDAGHSFEGTTDANGAVELGDTWFGRRVRPTMGTVDGEGSGSWSFTPEQLTLTRGANTADASYVDPPVESFPIIA